MSGRRPAFAFLFALLFACLVACGAAPTDDPAATSALALSSAKAVSITATQGGTKIVTLVSTLGIATTQYGADGNPIRGAIVRYDDMATIGLDYESQTFVSSTLGAMVDRRKTERAALATAVPSEEGVVPPPIPTPTLVRTKFKANIGGLKARAYDLSDGNGRVTRLWYAKGLPLPPAAVRSALASLEPASTASDGDDEEEDLPGIHPAGRQLVRVEQITSAGSTVTYDATGAADVSVPASTFTAPTGWTSRVLPPMTGGPVAPAFDGTQAPRSANVFNAGTIAEHPEVYVLMWGRSFAAPETSFQVQQLARGIDTIIRSSYTEPLRAYGVNAPRYMSLHVDGSDPPASAGGGGSGATVGTYVLGQTVLHSDLPPIWWEVGGHDPIYAVLIPSDVVDSSAWSGFHFVVYNFTELVLPFPVSLFAHDSLPYQVSKVAGDAFKVPFFIDAPNRVGCRLQTTPADACNKLVSFEDATVAFSHELVETCTDPMPFLGWSDQLRGSASTYGEIADICSEPANPYPWASRTLQGDVMVATYWYQPHGLCVPESRPSLVITNPIDGSTIRWQSPNGPSIAFGGVAHDPRIGDLPAQAIAWYLDGVGVGSIAGPLSVGPHHVEARYEHDNATGGTPAATADAWFFVTASPPTAYIDAPADGASIPNDQLLTMRFHADDPQDGILGDDALFSKVTGAFATSGGPGSVVVAQIPTGALGDVTISLTATNSAGLVASATRTVHIVAGSGKPFVSITAPGDGQHFAYPAEAFVKLRAAATLSIPDANIVWTDDVDGVLGVGRAYAHSFSGGNMAPTTHTITVTATDASGQSVSDTITIVVGTVG